MPEYCILCNAELSPNAETHPPFFLVGYRCPVCNISWTKDEHKNQTQWAIRHIRPLETDLKMAQDIIGEQQNMIFTQQTQIQELAKKIEELQIAISGLIKPS